MSYIIVSNSIWGKVPHLKAQILSFQKSGINSAFDTEIPPLPRKSSSVKNRGVLSFFAILNLIYIKFSWKTVSSLFCARTARYVISGPNYSP